MMLLVGTMGIPVSLMILHCTKDRRLESGSLRDYYPLLRAYLIASTVQWFVNSRLMAVSLALWMEGDLIHRP